MEVLCVTYATLPLFDGVRREGRSRRGRGRIVDDGRRMDEPMGKRSHRVVAVGGADRRQREPLCRHADDAAARRQVARQRPPLVFLSEEAGN
ncbi:unnamed protein product [Nesidiocoris tenuis]|uniref:Uncharacterized protein n=1 Tax=Nesidiocoris tenuis TaxID=355587 RepID=A0A6H5H738_9HEMI|nr:unnamed protein product [Nesidiocoris tenuis]